MYILTGDKKQIINSDFVERFCISEKPDAALIVGTKGDEFCDVPEADFLMDHLREEHKNID